MSEQATERLVAASLANPVVVSLAAVVASQEVQVDALQEG